MVYVIHFKSKFHHAQHYVGYCAPGKLLARIKRHMDGHGSKLMRAVTEAGIEWNVVHVWDDADRAFERSLKNKKKTRSFCPACSGKELSSFVANFKTA